MNVGETPDATYKPRYQHWRQMFSGGENCIENHPLRTLVTVDSVCFREALESSSSSTTHQIPAESLCYKDTMAKIGYSSLCLFSHRLSRIISGNGRQLAHGDSQRKDFRGEYQ